MRPKQKTTQAQIIGEYVLTLFLAVAVMTAMTVYVRRVLQARLFDARLYMINTVISVPHINKLRREYEPYYVASNSIVDDSQREQTNLLGGGHTGIFQKMYDNVKRAQTNSEQLPPANAD